MARQAGIAQFTGSEAPSITAMNNPHLRLAKRRAQDGALYGRAGSVKKGAVIWATTEYGKGGHRAFEQEIQTHGFAVVAHLPTEQAQTDFSADVVKPKGIQADAVFVYPTEEESARFLREARKQGLTMPLGGETTLIGAKVIERAGDAANGAQGHVGLPADADADADVPAIQQRGETFKAKDNYTPDPNAIKG